MLRTETQIRLTKPERDVYQILTGEKQLPQRVEEYNAMVEADAQRMESGEEDAEGRLLAFMIRDFKVEPDVILVEADPSRSKSKTRAG